MLPGFPRPISVPLRPGIDDTSVPLKSIEAIKTYVSTFMPDLAALPIAVTRLCFYTDTVDNSFLIDYIPGYNNSLFICTGGSGHGAKFTPILGKVRFRMGRPLRALTVYLFLACPRHHSEETQDGAYLSVALAPGIAAGKWTRRRT